MEKETIKSALHEYRQEREKESEKSDMYGLVLMEIFILSVILGTYFKSWLVFGGTLIGFGTCYSLPYVGVVFSIVLSAAWGFLAWMLFGLISPLLGILAGIIVFIISLGIHLIPITD